MTEKQIKEEFQVCCNPPKDTKLFYDDYWNAELSAKLADFDRITKDDYLELLRKTAFSPQITQRYLF